ncbi:MAG: TonB-dependent receptor [Candidatus Eisenbacteria sp.]|nr:TonB-dependent receptor [Candidatus Eisenbacteria bacterium]
MIRATFIMILGGIIALSAVPSTLADPAATEDELLFMEIPIVFASSKRLQPITEAASSIDIITAEDIRRSGATNLADVLRSVPGIDVRESDAGQHVVGVRGFCDTGHVLVTLDGNNVFMYHANHIFLDWAPFDLEEIDHIEIIKGPGAIFYGGNAFSGVINIITKTPEQLRGLKANFVGGNWNTIRGNVGYAGSRGNVSYHLSCGHRESEQWEEPKRPQERDGHTVDYATCKVVCTTSDQSSISLMGRYSDAQNVISSVCNPTTIFAAARYDRPDTWLRFFFNNHEKTFWNDTYEVKDSNCETEFFRAIRWGQSVTSFGGFVKHTVWEVNTLKETFEGGPVIGSTEWHDIDDAAVNVEHEQHLGDQFILTLGARGEYQTHLDYLGLGRGCLIYKPSPQTSLRFTVASGYYLPSLFQQTNAGIAYPFAKGNPDLDEEGITSYELSYYGRLGNGISLKATAYYNEYRDLIDNTQMGPAMNVSDGYQKGAELDCEAMLAAGVTVFANYTYQTLHRDDFGDLPLDPEHKVNVGMQVDSGRWSFTAMGHYVDHYYEMYLTSNPVFGRVGAGPSHVDSYNTVDAQLAYGAADCLKFSINASNIFNQRHYESNHPPDGWHTGDVVGRRITAGVHYGH